jgi:hypothetical protein
MKAAQVAFDAMGTNCVPYLVDKVRTEETIVHRAYSKICSKLPSMAQKILKRPSNPSDDQKIALWHLRNMVSRLDYMASDLMAIVPRIRDDRVREQAYDTIDHLAVRLRDVEKKKAYFLSFLGDRDFRIQLNSAIMLSRVDRSCTSGIPILISALTNKSLMDSTFRDPFSAYRPVSGGPMTSQVSFRQKAAFEALSTVAPLLADQYDRTKKKVILPPQEGL